MSREKAWHSAQVRRGVSFLVAARGADGARCLPDAPTGGAESVRAWGARWLDRRQAEGVRAIGDDRTRWRVHVEAEAWSALPLAEVSRSVARDWVARLSTKLTRSGWSTSTTRDRIPTCWCATAGRRRGRRRAGGRGGCRSSGRRSRRFGSGVRCSRRCRTRMGCFSPGVAARSAAWGGRSVARGKRAWRSWPGARCAGTISGTRARRRWWRAGGARRGVSRKSARCSGTPRSR